MSVKARDDWQILMEATLIPPAERLPYGDLARSDQRPPADRREPVLIDLRRNRDGE